MDGYDELSVTELDRDLARELRDHFNIELWCVLLAAFKVEASCCGLSLAFVGDGGTVVQAERWLLDRLGASLLEARRRHIMPFAANERIRIMPLEISDGYAYRWASTMIRALAKNGRTLFVVDEAVYASARAFHERYMAHRLKPERGVISVRASSASEAYALAIAQRKRDASMPTHSPAVHRIEAGSSNDGL